MSDRRVALDSSWPVRTGRHEWHGAGPVQLPTRRRILLVAALGLVAEPVGESWEVSWAPVEGVRGRLLRAVPPVALAALLALAGLAVRRATAVR